MIRVALASLGYAAGVAAVSVFILAEVWVMLQCRSHGIQEQFFVAFFLPAFALYFGLGAFGLGYDA